MSKQLNKIGPWIRRFLVEYLRVERNLSENTQQSYRDTIILLLRFCKKKISKRIDEINLEDLSTDIIRLFLLDLEESRNCSLQTRNQRLGAIRTLASFISERCPEKIQWCGKIHEIAFKKTDKIQLPYLDKDEIDELLDCPDLSTNQGKRDYALLLFLYNTGARASEAARLTIADLNLSKNYPSVRLCGKGKKQRHCPLWEVTVKALEQLCSNRINCEYLFLNQRKKPITRFGIHAMVQRYVKKASYKLPSLQKKRVSPHTIRHTTAMLLLRSGVDINTIRAWLGHVSINTTNIYVQIDLEMKAKALQKCDLPETDITNVLSENQELLEFLKNL